MLGNAFMSLSLWLPNLTNARLYFLFLLQINPTSDPTDALDIWQPWFYRCEVEGYALPEIRIGPSILQDTENYGTKKIEWSENKECQESASVLSTCRVSVKPEIGAKGFVRRVTTAFDEDFTVWSRKPNLYFTLSIIQTQILVTTAPLSVEWQNFLLHAK